MVIAKIDNLKKVLVHTVAYVFTSNRSFSNKLGPEISGCKNKVDEIVPNSPLIAVNRRGHN